MCLQCWRSGFNPWVGKVPWRRKWHPTPVFLPGKSHGQRNLVGYSPWGHKELDTTEQLTFAFTYILLQLCLRLSFPFSSVTQSCPTLCDPMDGSLPGSSVHGIFQARILEWVAISSSRGSSCISYISYVSCIGRQVFYH